LKGFKRGIVRIGSGPTFSSYLLPVLLEEYRHQFHPRLMMRLDNAGAIKAMIKSKLGVSMLPFWTVASEVREGTLQPARLKEPPLLGRLVLVTRKPAYLSQPVKAFLEAAQNWRWKDARRTK